MNDILRQQRTKRNRKAENTLITLFDAHARATEKLTHRLDHSEDHDVRGEIIECRKDVQTAIMNTAVDHVQDELRLFADRVDDLVVLDGGIDIERKRDTRNVGIDDMVESSDSQS